MIRDGHRRSALSDPDVGSISGAGCALTLNSRKLKTLIPEKITTSLDSLLQNQDSGVTNVTGVGAGLNRS